VNCPAFDAIKKLQGTRQRLMTAAERTSKRQQQQQQQHHHQATTSDLPLAAEQLEMQR